MSSTNAPTAIVDVYNNDGTFVLRRDFSGIFAESTARNYAETTGTIVSSGTSVVLTDLRGPSISRSYSTFLPDGVALGNSRLDAKDADAYGLGAITLKVFIVRKPCEEKRNPLHPQALTMEELTFGLNVQRYNRNYGQTGSVGIIIGEPFLSSKIPSRDAWAVKVATKNYDGKGVVEDYWFLADMGVVPYVRSDGSRHWDEVNYTLAV